MNIKDLKRRLAILESQALGADDTFLADLSDEQLLELYLSFTAMDNGAAAPPWPEWEPQPTADELRAAKVRVRDFDPSEKPWAQLSMRELMVVAFMGGDQRGKLSDATATQLDSA